MKRSVMDDESSLEIGNPEFAKLERQIERSQFFTHTALGVGFSRTGEMAAMVHGLIDVLLEKGVLKEAELKQAVLNVRQQMMNEGELAGPGTMIGREAGETVKVVEVDCSRRLPVCKGVCCKLNFALTIGEIESGKVKWDLGRPYFIRHEADGCCTHLRKDGGGCGVYADRPGVCRNYSCANDTRIWTDFDNMELNNAWIEANLPPGAEERWQGTAM